MPVYEYECTRCGHSFEKLQSVGSRPPRTCPQCSATGQIRRRVSAPAFQFKGSGWYVTDYAGKGRGRPKSDAAEGGGGDEKSAKGEDKSESKKAEKSGASKSSAKSRGDD